MMDVSGSMGEEQKELVRLESFWIDTWLRKNYEGIESRYIVHDVSAKEVDKHTFYHLREDGGTKISSAFKCRQATARQPLLARRVEHLPVPLLRRRQLLRSRQPRLREAAQGAAPADVQHVRLLPGRQRLRLRQLHQRAARAPAEHEKVLTSRVNSKDDIYDSIKTFFGKGH